MAFWPAVRYGTLGVLALVASTYQHSTLRSRSLHHRRFSPQLEDRQRYARMRLFALRRFDRRSDNISGRMAAELIDHLPPSYLSLPQGVTSSTGGLALSRLVSSI